MKILALDSTAVIASSAVCEFHDGEMTKYCLFSMKNGMTHSENLLPMIDSVIHRFNIVPDDIDLIALTAGPGSFTGVRIGVSTVKGLAFEKDIPVSAVSTLDSLYENVRGTSRVICPVMDARRNQFYNAMYIDGEKKTLDRLLSFEEIYAELKQTGSSAVICGDGAALFKSKCASDPDIILAPSACREQNALSVAVCGYRLFLDNKAISQSSLHPIYLRASQAERERNEKNENSSGL